MINDNQLIPPSPELKITSLKPFTKFCISIGMIPSSYKESMTYEEQLLWLCNYLENTVIPTVNNNGEVVTELQNLFIELKTYVDNYFTSLDVQEEINNKLDKMAEDGTLNRIINQEIFGDINNTISEIQENEFNSPVFPSILAPANSTPKIVKYDPGQNELLIFQKSNNGYLEYILNKKNGDTSEYSVGTNWDLLRLKNIRQADFAYVAKNTHTVSGTETILAQPSAGVNNITTRLFKNSKSITGSYSANGGLGCYGIDNTSKMTFAMKTTSNNKGNVLFFCSTLSSTNVDIKVNNEIVVKGLNLANKLKNNLFIQEITLPINSFNATDYNIEIINNDSEHLCYVSCVNYKPLDQYNGEDVDEFQIYHTANYFVKSDGASDYAIFDSDLNKWCGSYHGGETLESAVITKPSYDFNYSSYDNVDTVLSNIESATWWITNELYLVQITNINNKGKMYSKLDFTKNGMVDMQFSFYNGNINTRSFFTGLTCVSTDMNYLKNPKNTTIADDIYLTENGGHVTYSSNKNMGLDILYSKFYPKFITENRKNGWIKHDNNYNKFYYGCVDYQGNSNQPVNINNVQFRKVINCYNK